ncbi:polyketide synthetase [Hysterangium stoloniferum]|nr:polyketide synthetase [Hysterangium stoloniferum]
MPTSASTSLFSVFCENAASSPNEDFLVEDKNVVLSYGESRIIATQLIPSRLRNICPQIVTRERTTAIILSQNNALFALLYFTLWSMSSVAVPLSTSADPSLWAGMVQLIQPDLIFVSPSLLEPLRRSLDSAALDQELPDIISLKSLIPEEFFAQTGNDLKVSDYIPSCKRWISSLDSNLETLLTSLTPPSPEPECRAVTLFTSSAVDWSTLKCVSYTHSILLRSAQRCIQMLGGPEYSNTPKKHLGWLPLSHCFEFCITYCSIVLLTGGSYVFFDRSRSSPSSPSSTSLPPLLLSALAYHAPITSLTTIPALVPEIFTPSSDAVSTLPLLTALHSLGVGGAPTPSHLFSWAASRGIKYFDCSGATEAAGTICVRRSWNEFQRVNGLQVIPEVLGVLEKTNPSDDFGELIIRGAHLPVGYDHRESPAYQYDSTTGVTTYRTGDIYSHSAQVDVPSYVIGEALPSYETGFQPMAGLTYVGRTDDLIIFTSGIKIDALSLERILDAQEKIQRSALVLSPLGNSVVALIQPHSQFDKCQIVDGVLAINNSLPFEKRLRRENIYMVAELPVTTKFTLNRKKIKKVFSQIKSDSEISQYFPSPITMPPHTSDTPHTESSMQSAVDSPGLDSSVLPRLIFILSEIFSLPESQFTNNSSLSSIPLTSLSSVRLVKAIEEEFGVRVSGAQMYGIHSVHDLFQIVSEGKNNGPLISAIQSPGSTAQKAGPQVSSPSTLVESDILITGVACRFPGNINSLSTFWDALLAPTLHLKSLSRERPPSRWPSSHPQENLMYPSGWLDDGAAGLTNVSSIATFFGLSVQEVEEMCPNARLVLQMGYEAIEDAGIRPGALEGGRWAVYSSMNDSGWRERRVSELSLKDYASEMQGSADEAAGARLSYFLDLIGPVVEVKSACSSSAVAIHQASLAIRNGDCDAAVVVAATTHFHPSSALFRSKNGIVSPSGKCSPFSDAADGFVASEGTAAIVLQKADNTLARQMAYGMIKATTVTQDGRSRGFFAPNPKAQQRMLEQVLKKARVRPDDVAFLEAHGTGTRLGDEIELQVINEVFKSKRTPPLSIGSVKAVIGHTEECAGLAGILKILACLQNNAIPPQPAIGPLNKGIDLGRCHVAIPSKITPFFRHDDALRLCSVSSFGLYGTLANIIVQEVHEKVIDDDASDASTHNHPSDSKVSLFIISAHNYPDFIASVKRYLEFFSTLQLHSGTLETVCRTTQVARDHFVIRRAWAVTGWRPLLDKLHDTLHESTPRFRSIHHLPKVGLWFSLPFFSESVKPSHPLIVSKLEECRRAGWLAEYDTFVTQLALAKSLADLGCDISVVGGEGMTEYLAAVFVGLIPPSAVFRVRDDEKSFSPLVAARCSRRLLDENLMQWRSDELRVMGCHGSELFTIKGSREAIESLADGPDVTLNLNEPLPPATILAPVNLSREPSIPIVSSHLEEIIDPETILNINYWNHIQTREMRTDGGWRAMAAACDIVVNLGMTNDIAGVLGDASVSGHGGSLEKIVGALFEAGSTIPWDKFASKGPRVHLPPYSWAPDST